MDLQLPFRFRNRVPSSPSLRVFESDLEVAGVQFNRPQILQFCQGEDLQLEWWHEEGNPADRNAVRISGHSKSGGQITKFDLGYVQKYIAAALVAGSFVSTIQPRLESIYISESSFVIIEYSIRGPQDLLEPYWTTRRNEAQRIDRERATPVYPTPDEFRFSPLLAVELPGGRRAHLAKFLGWEDGVMWCYVFCRGGAYPGELTTVQKLSCNVCKKSFYKAIREPSLQCCPHCTSKFEVPRWRIGWDLPCPRCGLNVRMEAGLRDSPIVVDDICSISRSSSLGVFYQDENTDQ